MTKRICAWSLLFLLLVLSAWILSKITRDDYSAHRIPNTLLGYLLGLVLLWHTYCLLMGILSGKQILERLLWESWFGSAALWALYSISRGRWLGGGDVRFLWVVSAWLGAVDGFQVFWIGMILTLVLLSMDPRMVWKRGVEVPMGPGLSVAVWIFFCQDYLRPIVRILGRG